jgi:hypothetical protein
MEKILFSYDQASADSEVKQIDTIKEKIQKVIDEFVKLVPNSNLTIEEIKPFVFKEINILGEASHGDDINRQAKILVANKIVEKSKMNQIPINLDSFVKSMDIPDVKMFESSVREARVQVSIYIDPAPMNDQKVIRNPVEAIQITKNKVELKSEVIESIHEGYKKYLVTEDQHNRFEKAQKVAEALNEAVEAYTGQYPIANLINFGFIVELDENGKFKPAWGFINSELY